MLPETISEEPLGPVTPHDDGLWSDIVKTVMSMLIYAEAYGITSTTVPTALTGDVEVDRLFGLEGTYGQASLGLSQTAAQDVIRAVGNYGEIYERNLGSGGLGLSRENSRNALWALPHAPIAQKEDSCTPRLCGNGCATRSTAQSYLRARIVCA